MNEPNNSAQKRQWIEPSMEIVASVTGVSGSVGFDTDEDFTGLPS